jgi:NitT/TauT family transport system permease protein
MTSRLWAARVGFFVTLLLVWEGVARLGIWPSYLFPPPSEVLTALVAGLRDGLFVRGAIASLWRVAIGYAIAVVLGTILGVATGRSRMLDATLGSLILGLQALPSVCWLPLAILWFGLDERAIIFVVVMGALFSVALGVDAGVKNLPPVYMRAARNLGAAGPTLYTQVILPAAQPAILAGLKQGWTFAWRSLMAAELLYYTLSLGNLLQGGRDLNDAARVMAVMALIIGLAVSIDRGLFTPLERRLRERWGYGMA